MADQQRIVSLEEVKASLAECLQELDEIVTLASTSNVHPAPRIEELACKVAGRLFEVIGDPF